MPVPRELILDSLTFSSQETTLQIKRCKELQENSCRYYTILLYQINAQSMRMAFDKTDSRSAKRDEFFNNLKENYILRITECDSSSKHLLNACADVNTEFLFGILNLIQQYIELQKRYPNYYPEWYNYHLATQQSKIITQAWIQTVQYLDSLYAEFLKHIKNNLHFTNKGWTQIIQDMDRFYNIYQNSDTDQKDKTIEVRHTVSKQIAKK